MLDDGGLVTYDMPPDQVGEVFAVKWKHGCLSANDCFLHRRDQLYFQFHLANRRQDSYSRRSRALS